MTKWRGGEQWQKSDKKSDNHCRIVAGTHTCFSASQDSQTILTKCLAQRPGNPVSCLQHIR